MIRELIAVLVTGDIEKNSLICARLTFKIRLIVQYGPTYLLFHFLAGGNARWGASGGMRGRALSARMPEMPPAAPHPHEASSAKNCAMIRRRSRHSKQHIKHNAHNAKHHKSCIF